MKKLIISLSFVLGALPVVALAQVTAVGSNSCFGTGLFWLICRTGQLLNAVVPVLLALGIVYFVWGVVQYFIRSEEEAKKKGKDRIIYGIIGLAVIVGVWGLVYLVVDTFGLYGGIGEVPPLVPVVTDSNQISSLCDLSTRPKLQNVLVYLTCLIGNSVVPFLFALAVVMFVWGMIQYFLLNADEEKKRTQGKMFMLWGIIALVVMVSVWGLVRIVGDTFKLNTSFLPQVSPVQSR